MRYQLATAAVLAWVLCSAQVQLDVPVHFTGTDGERAVEGLGPPVAGSSAVEVRSAVATGAYSWAEAQVVVDTVRLTVVPALQAYRNGLMLRFKLPTTMEGPSYVRVGPDLPAVPLVRSDGLPPTWGQLAAGRMAEVLFMDDRCILMNLPVTGCPQGFVEMTKRLCIERTPVPDMLFHDAMQRCIHLGGRLCAWDEYVAACVLHGGELDGMLEQWEWLDETSDHTHGADQGGFETCTGRRQRSDLYQAVGHTRCCFHPR